MDDVRHRVASVDRRAIIMNPGLLESSLLSSRDPQVVPWHTSWARRGGTATTSAGCCMDQRTRADVSTVDSQCLAAEGARAASEHRAMEGQFLRSTRPAIMSRPRGVSSCCPLTPPPAGPSFLPLAPLYSRFSCLLQCSAPPHICLPLT